LLPNFKKILYGAGIFARPRTSPTERSLPTGRSPPSTGDAPIGMVLRSPATGPGAVTTEKVTVRANAMASGVLVQTPARSSAGKENGAELLTAVADRLRQHLVLPDGGVEAMALFAAHAHACGVAQHSPILALESPTTGCGKSTALRILAELVPNPLRAFNVSAAGIYRSVDANNCTLLLDEAHTYLANRQVIGMLSGGHARDSGRVVRATGIFEVFGPKIIALIGQVPDALDDRSIKIGLQRKLANQTVVPLTKESLLELRRLGDRLAGWTNANIDQLAAAEPVIPPSLVNRAADNWRPLLAVAEVAAGDWPQKAGAIATMASAGYGNAPEIILLADLRMIFAGAMTDRMATGTIIMALVAIDGRPWAEWRGGQPIKPHQLASMLRTWRIFPRTLRFSSGLAKGYLRADFEAVFLRYLREEHD
jgi:hypothetical protein